MKIVGSLVALVVAVVLVVGGLQTLGFEMTREFLHGYGVAVAVGFVVLLLANGGQH